jgi:bifunctional non-homologous end joining protein LigD
MDEQTFHLCSRNDKDFTRSYPAIVKALAGLPDETIIDGEIVALDESGRPAFNALQNHASGKAPVVYYIFDVMRLEGVVLIREPLSRRRELLEQKLLPRLSEPVNYSAELESDLPDLVQSSKRLGLGRTDSEA